MVVVALVVVSAADAAAVAAFVNDDETAERRGLQRANEGPGLSGGAMGRPGRECRRFRGSGGRFEAGEVGVLVIVDAVVNDDVC